MWSALLEYFVPDVSWITAKVTREAASLKI